MIVLLDSSAWLEYFFGSERGEKIKAIVESDHDIIVSKVNLFELFHKILRERCREDAEKFVSFVVMRSIVDEMDIDTIKLAAEEKKKFGLAMADAFIAATAIKYDATLYTWDKDFETVGDLISVVFI